MGATEADGSSSQSEAVCAWHWPRCTQYVGCYREMRECGVVEMLRAGELVDQCISPFDHGIRTFPSGPSMLVLSD